MGAIYWRQGNVDAALEEWQAIMEDDSDSYAHIYSAIVSASKVWTDSPVARAVIDRALGRERSQWRSFSYDRLAKFGYRFDTF